MLAISIFSLLTVLCFVLLPGKALCFCVLGSDSLHADLTRAAIRSSDWMRQFYGRNSSLSIVAPYRAGSMILTLRISGHHPHTLLSEFKNAHAHSVEDTLKNRLDTELATNGNLNGIPAGRLSYIVSAVIAMCKNPADFHGHDLYKALRHGVKSFKKVPTFTNYFQYSLVAIAFCNGGVPIPEEMVRELLKGARRKSSIHSVDINALILVALSCVGRGSSLSTKVDLAVAKLVTQLKAQQDNVSGGFGNQYSTGLAVQALQAARVHTDTWYCEKAMRHILSYQDEEGSFGNILANVQVTPSLLGESFISLKNFVCPTTAPTVVVPKKITVRVNLVFNDTVNPLRVEPAVNVTLLEGNTAFDVLQLAKKVNPCYTATYKQYSFGRSITSICGVASDPLASLYWLIYVDGTSAKTGVDGLKPKDGQLITFKYGKLAF